MHLIGSVSAFGSLSVMMVYWTSREVSKRSYNSIIMCVVFCDFFSCLGAGLGLAKDGSAKCWFQGIMTNYFPLAGVFWTTWIAITVYRIAQSAYHKDLFSNSIIIICWTLPLILTLLPLTTNTYGVYDPIVDDRGWCFIDDRRDSPNWTNLFWAIMSFYFW